MPDREARAAAQDRDFASLVVSRANLLGHSAYSQVEWCNMAAKLGYIVLRLTKEAETT